MKPFSIDLFQQGWKPVTRDGRDVEGFERDRTGWFSGKIDGKLKRWYPNGSFWYYSETWLDLFLLPPDDDIVVYVISTTGNGNDLRWDGDGVDRLEPGRYKLVKID